MSDALSNIPKSLRDALIANEVVPFVGAGASMSVRKKTEDGRKSDESLFPSWKGYVEILAQALTEEGKPDEANLVEAYIKSAKPKYLEAMQHAFEELPKSVWYEKLDEYFKKDGNEAAHDSLELPKLIWQLGSNVIFTTNIDRVLEWKSVKEPPIEQLNRQNVEFAQLQADKNPPPTIFYLHGRVGDNENIVFTRKQYDDFYRNSENEAKLKTLQAFLTTKSFLFIGFSLDDAYFVEELKNIREIYKGGAKQYYALIKRSDEGKLKEFDFVTEVYYEDFGEPLLEVLREMRDIAQKNKGSIVSPIFLPPEPEKNKPFFNVPYNSKGKEFVGREGKTKEIWDLLNQEGLAAIGQAVSVRGFGGLGKTQLAVEYAHEYKNKYKNGVFWVIADESIDNQLLQIADKQKWINQYDKSVNQLEVAKKKFLALSDCLILFDNVEAYKDIEEYVPEKDLRPHILITSRYKQAPFKQIDLELLERHESRDLLLKISGRVLEDADETAHLEQILEILGDIPLAIELVGGYLAEKEIITFAKYHQFLDEVPLDQLEKEFPEGSFTGHDRSIIQTLRISEQVINEKPLMVEILKVLAWSGSSSMGISLLRALIETESDFDFDNALADAHKLRLLKKDEDAERYAIHRLLAKVIRHEKPLENQKEWHEEIVSKLEHWFGNRASRFVNLVEYELEIEHLEAWQEQTFRIIPVKAVLLTLLRATVPEQYGLYEKSSNWIKKSFEIYESENLDNKQTLAIIYSFIGSSVRNFGNFQEALHYKLQSLNLRQELFSENHTDIATSLNDVGNIYNDLGDYQKALEYLLKALKIYQKLFGEDDPHTATTLNNIGLVYNNLGNQEEALKYLLKALAVRRNLLGEKHPDTVVSLSNVGTTYSYLKNHEEALKYLLQALHNQKKLYKGDSPLAAVLLNNIGSAYGDLGKLEEALKYQLQALKIHQELFPENQPEKIAILNNVGSAYVNVGNYKEALKYQLQALEVHQKSLGKQHPKTTIIVGNLITTYLKLGDDEKAGRKAAEFYSYVPQNNPYWKWFEEVSRPYRKKKDRHRKRRR